jgi:RecJ-like exonuclease
MPEVALRVCMGDRGESYNSALSLLAEHRRQLREAIEFLHSAGIEERETFYFFDSGDKIKDSIVGIVAGMLYGSGILAENKPIFAFARSEDGLIKVSGRGTQDLVYRGLNLGKLLKEICAELGDSSNGGGHKIAAGCRISPEHREKFLSLLSQKLKVQLGIRQ